MAADWRVRGRPLLEFNWPASRKPMLTCLLRATQLQMQQELGFNHFLAFFRKYLAASEQKRHKTSFEVANLHNNRSSLPRKIGHVGCGLARIPKLARILKLARIPKQPTPGRLPAVKSRVLRRLHTP